MTPPSDLTVRKELPILYRDEFLVAVHKPAGLLVHRSELDRHETHFALQIVRDQIGQRVYPVHRLDKPTAGVLVFALNAQFAARMMDLFLAGGIAKTYLAVVRGVCPELGEIDHPLREETEDRRQRPPGPDAEPQPAVTAYRRLAEVELPFPLGPHATSRYSLVELNPKTGRRHQLRRHMKHLFHPIIGDTTHGDGRHNALFRREFDCARLLLAAVRFEFIHPETGDAVSIRAPLDDGFSGIVSRFGWESACREF